MVGNVTQDDIAVVRLQGDGDVAQAVSRDAVWHDNDDLKTFAEDVYDGTIWPLF